MCSASCPCWKAWHSASDSLTHSPFPTEHTKEIFLSNHGLRHSIREGGVMLLHYHHLSWRWTSAFSLMGPKSAASFRPAPSKLALIHLDGHAFVSSEKKLGAGFQPLGRNGAHRHSSHIGSPNSSIQIPRLCGVHIRLGDGRGWESQQTTKLLWSCNPHGSSDSSPFWPGEQCPPLPQREQLSAYLGTSQFSLSGGVRK